MLSLINFRGIKESVTFNLGCTAIELTGLVLVAVIGAAFLLDGGGDAGRAFEFKEGDAPLLLAILSGASLAFYALIGFEDSVNVAEETRDRAGDVPERALPRPRDRGRRLPPRDADRLDGRADRHAGGAPTARCSRSCSSGRWP